MSAPLFQVEHADYGRFQVIGVPGDWTDGGATWGVAVWDGLHVAYVCPERLRPLDGGARALLRTGYSGPFATRADCRRRRP